jgi:hypothetical protein
MALTVKKQSGEEGVRALVVASLTHAAPFTKQRRSVPACASPRELLGNPGEQLIA